MSVPADRLRYSFCSPSNDLSHPVIPNRPSRQVWQDRQLKPLVLVNLAANQGKGGRRWEKVAPNLKSMLPEEAEYILYRPPFLLESILNDYVRANGFNCIISAGGDGTVNLILNKLMNLPGIETENVYLGGIGLGSSNDFLKPVETSIDSVPSRIRPENSLLADVGKVRFTGDDGEEKTRYFIVNASLGITAEANSIFNRADPPIPLLKPRMLNVAILYAAVKTILTFNNFPVILKAEPIGQGTFGETKFCLSNLSVLKKPHVSGSFVYDQDIRADDGWLGLNYCSEMSKWELLSVLWDLRTGRFAGKPKRFSIKVRKVEVLPEKCVALEMDGEVIDAKEVRFSLARRKINLLG